MKLKALLPATAIGVFLATGAYAESLTAQQFVQKASVSNLFEIESSKLAKDRASSAEVKEFADMMIIDHGKAGSELEAITKDAGLDSGLVATALDAKHMEKMEELRAKEADDFDSTYIDMQQDAHDKAVDLFGDYAENGDNAGLKAFAAKTLPVLRKHKAVIDNME